MIYLSHRLFYFCTRKYSANCTIPVFKKNQAFQGGGHIRPSDTPPVRANVKTRTTPLYDNKEAYI